MSKGEKIEERFEKRAERKKREREIVSSDDAPMPDAPIEQAHSSESIGRNDPCSCGSGKKYKKCCGKSS